MTFTVDELCRAVLYRYHIGECEGPPSLAVILSGGCKARPAIRRTLERKPDESCEAFWARICEHAVHLSVGHSPMVEGGAGLILFYKGLTAADYAARRGDDIRENHRLALHWIKNHTQDDAARMRATLQLLELDNLW